MDPPEAAKLLDGSLSLIFRQTDINLGDLVPVVFPDILQGKGDIDVFPPIPYLEV